MAQERVVLHLERLSLSRSSVVSTRTRSKLEMLGDCASGKEPVRGEGGNELGCVRGMKIYIELLRKETIPRRGGHIPKGGKVLSKSETGRVYLLVLVLVHKESDELHVDTEGVMRKQKRKRKKKKKKII